MSENTLQAVTLGFGSSIVTFFVVVLLSSFFEDLFSDLSRMLYVLIFLLAAFSVAFWNSDKINTRNRVTEIVLFAVGYIAGCWVIAFFVIMLLSNFIFRLS